MVRATITDGYTDKFTDSWRTSRNARLSEAWSVCTFTDEVADVTFTNGSKSLVGFLKFLVRISINYRWNLMSPTITNVPSVIPSEKLLYKTPLPPFGLFFLSALHLYFSSPLRLYLVFGRGFIVFVVVLNILKGMYSSFFIFVIFFYFFILIMIIFLVFFVLCIVCR
jgi:hypothetical protein